LRGFTWATGKSSVLLTLDGIEGDAHAGRTHKTGAREPAFRRGTLVANTRQLSLVSVEELRDIASRLGIAHIDPAWVAANIATEGAGPITQLPPGTLLRASSGATIYIAELNFPCRAAARLIAQHVAYAGDAAFVRHAKGRRGVVGFVYASGTLQTGDEFVVLHAKAQPPKD
jgi:MOSC domain-containing protein YiiM